MAAHKCWVRASCGSFLSTTVLGHTFRGLIQKPPVKLGELPERAHCTVTGVSMRHRLHKWSQSWELGSHDGLSCCLSTPQVSLENWLALRTVRQGETRLETGELGDAYTKAAMKKKRWCFCLFSYISASVPHSTRQTDILLFVQKNGIHKARSKLATCEQKPTCTYRIQYIR